MLDPVEDAIWPAGQLLQTELPDNDEYFPDAHEVQPTDPEELYCPLGQLVHTGPPDVTYWPAGQFVQQDEPPVEV